MNTALKSLPIGIQTFRKLIEGDYLYIDKTRSIYELIRPASGVYFLSRPRRFGKSLLISTLEEIFLGNRELFQGLWLYDSDYVWNQHPVIRIDLSLQQVQSAEELKQSLKQHLSWVARDYQITLPDGEYHTQFAELIFALAKQNQVVVLIDEYDKPLIDHLDDIEQAQQIREILKGFYSVLKSLDRHLRFVLLSGVSKFSRVGVFSGLNNLIDLSLNQRFATALGLTENEIKTNLKPHIEAFAEARQTTTAELINNIRHWYNGFCFSAGAEQVYNPFSTLLLFYHQRFSNYWFESGTPTFLIKLIKQHRYDIQQLPVQALSELDFSVYELENLAIIPLLFQTGYLTIKDYDEKTQSYTLDYPNYEVESSFLSSLLSAFSEVESSISTSHLSQLIKALTSGDLNRFFEVLQVFFAQIPYDIQLRQEKYYQTVFYLIFTLVGLQIQAEVTTNKGRIDTVIELDDQVYLFEFKLDDSADKALEQIKTTQYYQRYQDANKTIRLVGVNFNTRQREVESWVEEVLK